MSSVSSLNASPLQAGSCEKNDVSPSLYAKFRNRSACILIGALSGGIMGLSLTPVQLKSAYEPKSTGGTPNLAEAGIVFGMTVAGAVMGGIAGYYAPVMLEKFTTISPCSTTRQLGSKLIEQKNDQFRVREDTSNQNLEMDPEV